MNNKSIINKAKEKLEYYRSLHAKPDGSELKRVTVDKSDGLVRRFINKVKE